MLWCIDKSCCLKSWHPIWVPDCDSTVPLPIHLLANGLGKTEGAWAPATYIGDFGAVPSSSSAWCNSGCGSYSWSEPVGAITPSLFSSYLSIALLFNYLNKSLK